MNIAYITEYNRDTIPSIHFNHISITTWGYQNCHALGVPFVHLICQPGDAL